MSTYLRDTTLEGAVLYQTELFLSSLCGCDLRNSDMRGAKLHDADMSGAILTGANLYRCDFINTQLRGTTFQGAYCGTTAFSNVDLSVAVGLHAVMHIAPSNIDLLTISRSRHALPFHFLSGAGVPQSVLKAVCKLPENDVKPPYRSCFISYSHKDEPFAAELYRHLIAEHVTVWFAPKDIQPGLKLHDQIVQAIGTHDKLIVVLSRDSMCSNWVMTELRNARRREEQEGRQILLPVSLVPMEEVKQWRWFDADIGKDIAVEVREYFILDFSQWHNSRAFKEQFGRLLNGITIRSTTAPAEADLRMSSTRVARLGRHLLAAARRAMR